MKQKNSNELRDIVLTNNSNDKKEKLNILKNELNLKNENIAIKNEELIMRKKIFNSSNKSNGNKINSFSLTNKKIKDKNNMKLLLEQQNFYNKKFNNNDGINSNDSHFYNNNNLLVNDKLDNKKKYFLGNNNNFNIKHNDLLLKNNKNENDIKLFSFYGNKNNNMNINNINSIKTESNKKKHKVLSKSGNKNIDYRKHFFNEKIDVFNYKKMKDLNEDKTNNKNIFKIEDMKHKGLFYLYNLQNNIYNKNKKNKNSENLPSFNFFNKTNNNINNNITHISKYENSYSKKPIILFPKSVNNSVNRKNKYNTFNSKNTKLILNDIFTNKTNQIKGEENIFQNKMKFKKQNYKNKYLNIFTQNNLNSSDKKKIHNTNLLTSKNLENEHKKIKLKLIKEMNNNKTEVLLLKDKNNDINKFSTYLFGVDINDDKNHKNKDIYFDKGITNSNLKNDNNNKLNTQILSKNNNNTSLNNISEISKISTSAKDSKYFMNKSLSLINYIKNYYLQNKSYPETKINFYLYGRRIGQGAFGKVNLGLNVLTGRVVAIKSFKKKPIEKFRHKMKKIQSETELMKRFNHKNITKILEVFNDEEYMLIVMEYINGGNLFSFVKKRRKLSEKMARFLFRQIILGIHHIHSKNVVHRDIKLENILIDFNNNVKICDFGIGKVLDNENQLLFDKCGTPMYMAPEIVLANENNGYKGFPVDIWSSGITLYIMLSGNLPFSLRNKNKKEDILLSSAKDKNNVYLENQIINVNPKKIEYISKEAQDLLEKILNKDPEKRLTCLEILNHPWLKQNSTHIEYLNLFTKAEMTMMSKTYIDYRKGELEDLKENFTLSNLRNDAINLEEKNITTKSTILDPFNSCINDNISSFDESISNEDLFDDFKNEKIKLENDIVIFNNKVKEFNLNFEVNNNQEIDNGMIIKTHSDLTISSASSILSSEFKEDNNNVINKYDDENNNNTDMNILNEMEQFGYDKKYVLSCIENNKLCHATTVFYLLKNYRDIE